MGSYFISEKLWILGWMVGQFLNLNIADGGSEMEIMRKNYEKIG